MMKMRDMKRNGAISMIARFGQKLWPAARGSWLVARGLKTVAGGVEGDTITVSDTEMLWAGLGLVPAVLAFTGVFLCCHRMIYDRSSNPNR